MSNININFSGVNTEISGAEEKKSRNLMKAYIPQTVQHVLP